MSEFDFDPDYLPTGAVRREQGAMLRRLAGSEKDEPSQRVDRATAGPLLEMLKGAAQGVVPSRRQLESLTVRDDMSPAQVRAWRSRVRAVAERIADVRADGSMGAARTMAAEAAAALGQAMAPADNPAPEDETDDPRELAALIRRPGL